MSNLQINTEDLPVKESYKKSYLISAGHSETDPGAVNGRITESDLVTELRDIILKKLTEKKVKAIGDGAKGENQPLAAAIKLANGRVSYELHFNASDNKGACGVESISQSRDQTVAQKISQGIAAVLGTKIRGDKGWIPQTASQHSRLGFVVAGGTIIEVCFISNEKELASYQAKKYLVADAIIKAILGD